MDVRIYNNYVRNLYAGIVMNVNKISNYLGHLYANITVDVKTFYYYLEDLYVGVVNLRWSYGSYNKKDVGIACLTS
jgi:hypothetical protein